MIVIPESSPKQPNSNAGSFSSLIQSAPISKHLVQEAKTNENKYTPENVTRQVALANSNSNRVSYAYNKEIDTVVVTVHDRDSDDVVRQMPSREFIDMKIALKDHIGKILDIEV